MKPTRIHRAFCVVSWLLFGLSAGVAAAQERTNGFAFADFLLVPLRVHLLTAANEPAVHTTLTSNDVTRILGKVNRVWMQAGIAFYLESLRVETATNTAAFRDTVKTNTDALLQLRPADSRGTNVFHVYYLKQFGPNGICIRGINFVKDTASLRAVEGGIDEPLPRVTAHELGHALTLPHRQNVTNLLASGTTGTWLNEAEIKQVRAAAKERSWVEPAATMLKRAEQSPSAEANTLFRWLANIPLTGQEAERFKLLSPEHTKAR